MNRVPDERGLGKQIKRVLPAKSFRLATVVFNAVMRPLPFPIKYAVAGRLRRNHAPYRLLAPDDTVVQVGSARDVLHAGRSRAVHLARVVPRGRVVVIEADEANCRALEEVITKNQLNNITVVHSGAWDKKTTLLFLSSPNHPASNLVEEAKDLSEDLLKQRKYEKHAIEVDTVDSILSQLELPVPALVSITTNGAELRILGGMRQTIANGCEYISLASTGEGFIERMESLGYQYSVRDDRGYCFRRKSVAHSQSECDVPEALSQQKV